MKLQLLSKRATSIFLGLVVLLGGSVAYVIASDGATAAYNAPIDITGPESVCINITNLSGTGLSEYVPTATVAEWQDFYTQPPAGVTTRSCTTPCSGKSCSDIRLKKDIKTLADIDGLNAILKLRPVTFHWKDVNEDSVRGEQIGFIAQEVESVLPDVVTTGTSVMEITLSDGTKQQIKNPKAVSYANVVAPLVKAVQQLEAENQKLKAQNSSLAERVLRLEQLLER